MRRRVMAQLYASIPLSTAWSSRPSFSSAHPSMALQASTSHRCPTLAASFAPHHPQMPCTVLWARGFAKRNRILNLPRLRPVAAAAKGSDSGTFYSSDSTRFSELGIGPSVEAALNHAGFSKPSKVQEMAMPLICKGRTAVIAAETGSGKTLAYLAPVASMLVRQKERLAQDDQERKAHALVLCPNLALCQQVLSVSQSLRASAESTSLPVVSAAIVNASNPPPQDPPDIIISTPAALAGLLSGPGPSYGFLWTPEGMQAKVRHVILDEADLLLSGSYEKPVKQLMMLFRTGDRRRVEAKIFQELSITKDDFDRLPREMQVAGWAGGSEALRERGYRVPGGWQQYEGAKFGPYWRRQYAFVAATMPAITLSDVGSGIQRMFPNVEWISSNMLHQSKPKVKHTWREVDSSSFRRAVISALCEDPDYAKGTAKVLVFCLDTAAADELSAVLDGEGLKHVLYHKNVPSSERDKALQYMQYSTPADGARVMVCTDAAARGLDIQDVTHVVQADFAPNAIDFIHRIGRTGRADRRGKVTSLYRAENLALVQVLKQYISEGRPLEAAFSRARSFSRKLKRSGGDFVPRGFTKQGYEQARAEDTEGTPVT